MTSSPEEGGIKPEAGIPFALYFAGHVYVALFEVIRWYMGLDRASSCLIIAIIALLTAMDNWRLLKGAMLGQKGLSTNLTTGCFVAHFGILPLLWIPLGDIFANLTGWSVLGIVARMFGVMSCVRGFNELMVEVVGNYEVIYTGDLWRHTLKAEKKSFSLILPTLLLVGAALFLSFCLWISTGHRFSLILQLLGILGQYMARKDQEYGVHLSNFLEVVFITDIVFMQCYVAGL